MVVVVVVVVFGLWFVMVGDVCWNLREVGLWVGLENWEVGAW